MNASNYPPGVTGNEPMIVGGDDVVYCEWFALCVNPAAGVVRHPVLGDVPTCSECATSRELDLVVVPDDVDVEAECLKCGETFMPAGIGDLEHIGRLDGETCLGRGVITGWRA